MASLQYVTQSGRDSWKLRFYMGKSRKVVGLRSLTEVEANEAKDNIEHLIECSEKSRTPCRSTRQWLDQISDAIHDRLATLGLCEARLVRDLPRSLIAYSRNYIDGRKDSKKPENYRQSVDKLETFLGKDIPLVSLTKGEAERWHRWMIDELQLRPPTGRSESKAEGGS